MFVDSKCWALRFESCSVGENVKRVTLFFYKEQNVLNLRRVHLGEWYSPTSQKIENRGRSLCETGLKCNTNLNVAGMDIGEVSRGTMHVMCYSKQTQSDAMLMKIMSKKKTWWRQFYVVPFWLDTWFYLQTKGEGHFYVVVTFCLDT